MPSHRDIVSSRQPKSHFPFRLFYSRSIFVNQIALVQVGNIFIVCMASQTHRIHILHIITFEFLREPFEKTIWNNVMASEVAFAATYDTDVFLVIWSKFSPEFRFKSKADGKWIFANEFCQLPPEIEDYFAHSASA